MSMQSVLPSAMEKKANHRVPLCGVHRAHTLGWMHWEPF